MIQSKEFIEDADRRKWLLQPPYSISLGKEYNSWQEQLNYMLSDDRITRDNNYDKTIDQIREFMRGDHAFYDMLKYSDTTVGGSDVFNPYWQFNVDDDIVHPMYELDPASNKGEEGLGRVYTEMYQENEQILWLAFGVPKYAGMLAFAFGNKGSSALSRMMNTGDAGIIKKLAAAVFDGIKLAITIPFLPLVWMNRLLDLASDDTVSKYFNFHPTMTLFYESVNTILIQLATGMNLIEPLLSTANMSGGTAENEIRNRFVKEGMPELLKDGIDIFTWLDKRTAKSNLRNNVFYGNAGDETINLANKYIGALAAMEKRAEEARVSAIRYGANPDPAYQEKAAEFRIAYAEAMAEIERMKDTIREAQRIERMTSDERRSYEYHALMNNEARRPYSTADIIEDMRREEGARTLWTTISGKDEKTGESSFIDQVYHTAIGNGAFIGYRIEKSVDASESFQNSTGETEIAQKLNAEASAAYEKRLSISNLKTGVAPLDSAVNAVEDVAKTLGNLLGQKMEVKTGNGYFDIPEAWKNSSFSKSHSITLKFRSRLGDPVSIFQSIWVPLAPLLAGTLPRTIGSNMYTSPFLCQGYCKGMFSIPLGIIESMSIQRGDSEFGWSKENLPLVVTVNLSIRDLNPIMHLSLSRHSNKGLGGWLWDIATGDLLNSIAEIFSKNDTLQEYLTTLSGVGLRERVYGWPHFVRRWTSFWKATSSNSLIWNSSYRAFWLGNTRLAKTIAAVTPASDVSHN